MEDELDITLNVEEGTRLEQALQVNIERSIVRPTGEINDLLLPPTTQGEVHRSQFRQAFELF